MEDINTGDWIPYKLRNTNGELQCLWLNTYGKVFSEPFFEETICKCLQAAGPRHIFSSISSLRMMAAAAPVSNVIAPAAFIFHISRCGSTLISQMLAASGRNIVLSEVPFFDGLLRLPYADAKFDDCLADEFLSAAPRYYGLRKTSVQERLFIKTDSWHLFFYERLRRLYPRVPFIILYRNPAEVYASQQKKAGMQAVPGLIEPKLYGFNPADNIFSDPGAYLPAVLEALLGQCIRIAENDSHSLLLDYSEGPVALIKKIAAFTNMPLDEDELKIMESRSRYHSKDAGEPFYKDPVAGASPRLDKAMMMYQKLEEKRSAFNA